MNGQSFRLASFFIFWYNLEKIWVVTCLMEDFIVAENYIKIDAFKDYWIVNGKVREMYYKLLSAKELLNKYDYNNSTLAIQGFKKAKEDGFKTIRELIDEYKKYDEKTGVGRFSGKECTVNFKKSDELYQFAVENTHLMIEGYDLYEKMQDEVLNVYSLVNRVERKIYDDLSKCCSDKVLIYTELAQFCNKKYLFETSNDYDRIDNIHFYFGSKKYPNSGFESAWNKNNDIKLLHKQVQNKTKVIERLEDLHQQLIIGQANLISQTKKEEEIKVQKNLNATMLLLAVISAIGGMTPFFIESTVFKETGVITIFISFLIVVIKRLMK